MELWCRGCDYRRSSAACNRNLSGARLFFPGPVEEVLALLRVERRRGLTRRDHPSHVRDSLRVEVEELQQLVAVRMLEKAVGDRMDLHFGRVFVAQRQRFEHRAAGPAMRGG